MAKVTRISEVQADILTTVAENGICNDGERIPWYAFNIPPTWSMPLTGLIKRGLLKERKRAMYDLTPEGEAALKAWQDDVPPMTVY
jgi:hypothetical protein